MTMTDYRKAVNSDEEITTPTAMPRYTVKQSLALCVAIAGHSTAIGEMDPMQFYRFCCDAMVGRPKKWKALRMLFCDQVDALMKWNMVLELLRAGVVKVEDGMLVKREREEVAA